jgi:hypothetical protein
VASKSVAKTDQSKVKIQRESSRRPGPGVQSTLGVTKQPGDDRRRLPWNKQHNMSASICTGAAA